MRYYFYIIRNNANCFYSKKVKLGESPFVDCPNKDFTDVARYSDKSKADKVAEQLNKTFSAFQHRVKDRFFSVRKSIVIEDTPKVVVKDTPKDNRPTSEKLAELKERFRSERPNDSYHIDSQFDVISKATADLFGNDNVKFVFPYSTFVAEGSANLIAEETKRSMPFAKDPIENSDITTMYYDKGVKLTQGNYLPYLAESDTFYIDKVEDDTIPTIYLKDGLYWRHYL
jgi:hypothetical protein